MDSNCNNLKFKIMTVKQANQIKKIAMEFQRDKELRKAYLLGAAKHAQLSGLSKQASVKFAKIAAANFEKRAALEDKVNQGRRIHELLSGYLSR